VKSDGKPQKIKNTDIKRKDGAVMDALHISRPPGVRVNPLPLNRLIPSPPSDGWKTPDEYFDRPNQWSGAGFVNLISSNLIPCRLGGFQETSVNMRDEPNLTGLPPRSEYCPPSDGWKPPDEYFDRPNQWPGAVGFVSLISSDLIPCRLGGFQETAVNMRDEPNLTGLPPRSEYCPPSGGWKTPDEYFDRQSQCPGAGFVNHTGYAQGNPSPLSKSANSGGTLDVNICTSLIRAHINAGKNEEAFELFDEMKRCNVKPNADIYHLLMGAHINAGKIMEAVELLNEMKRCKVKPNANTYHLLIEAHINAGKIMEAVELLNEMKRCNVKPNADIYHLLMGAHINAGKIMEAVELLNEMKRCKVKPNANTYHLLIEAHINAGEKQEAFELFNEMKTCKFKSRADTYHLLIKAYIKENCIDEARILYNEMPQHGVKPAKRSLSALCNAYARNNQIDKARDFSRQQFQSTAVTK
jgi:pentatricopeptide repeat protein